MTQVIAHRGASAAERENTLAAYRRAVAMGADGIELDVRRSADGILVCHHDARLGDGRIVAETVRAALPADVPTFTAALDACHGAWVNVEIKNSETDPDFDERDTIAEHVMAALAARCEPPTNWLVSCFRVETIDRCRAIEPGIDTALLTFGIDADLPAAVAARGHAAIHPWDPLVDGAAVARCHDAGLRVNVWTCNDVARAVELAACGTDGVCTDVPDELLTALARSPRA